MNDMNETILLANEYLNSLLSPETITPYTDMPDGTILRGVDAFTDAAKYSSRPTTGFDSLLEVEPDTDWSKQSLTRKL